MFSNIDSKISEEKHQTLIKTKNLKNNKGDKGVNCLFVLDQKLIKLEENLRLILLIIFDCVDQFAWE